MSVPDLNRRTGPVRLAVIGCGVIGRVHIGAAARSGQAEVVAVADLSESALAQAAADFAVRRTYRDAYELLADDEVEAVVIALPAFARQDVVIAAMRAGKHILVEKPPAATSADLAELLALRGDLVVGSCSPRFRTSDTARAATELISRGVLGELRAINVRGHRPAPPRPAELPPAWRLNRELNGGGVLWNWGPYDLDFVLGLCGWRLEPETVFGQTWPISPELAEWVPEGSDAESHASAIVRFTNGCVLNLERGEYLPIDETSLCEFIGTHGSLRIDMLAEGDCAVTVREFRAAGVETTTTLAGSPENNMAGRAVNLISDFARAVRSGGRTLTTLENSLTILRIAEAIRESARTGDSQRIAPVPA